MTHFPKVLIISIDPFNKSNGTGITLSNLFEGWDKNAIAQMYISEMEIDTDICANYFKLSAKTAYFDFYLRKALSFFSGNNKGVGSVVPAAVTLNNENKSFKNTININMRAIADFSPIFLPESLFQWINEFKPDIIYCALGNARMLDVTNSISKRIKTSIVPHFMDDWPNTLYTQNELYGTARSRFHKRFNEMLSHSNGGLCISELMAKEYEQRYKLSFEAFVNCVDDALFYPPLMSQDESVFTLMYIGGLHLNRWKSLLDISKVLEELNQNEKKITLEIYCPLNDIELYSHHFNEYNTTKFEGSIKSKEVSDTLKKASLLVHIESFDKNFANYTRLSLSTKIPLYMASGKPILGYGPGNLASMQHIIKAKAGEIVSNNGTDELLKTIQNLIKETGKLNNYSQNGFAYALKFHSKSFNINNLRNILIVFSNLSLK